MLVNFRAGEYVTCEYDPKGRTSAKCLGSGSDPIAAGSYAIIDEYQDLYACDLAVIRALASRRCEVFVAGDDDQSIKTISTRPRTQGRRSLDEVSGGT